ncbi:tyrosine-type recombinase/integrase [Melghirimyces algeriensis]|uniref:Integrase/recombinase XerD n=1 Tax=Melghirimyces algeriensis TaxID=910412 RepID=A0A521F7U9_9BACL|nr:tyrosine-type recombinase/integrase [Melghirimyces algeriensis]SMO92259.1 integrase/recombinase XerD [Melghirimyces algeriensis]
MPRRRNKLDPEQLAAPAITNKTVDSFEMSLDSFLRDCRVRNLSESTVRFYRNELNTFQKMLEEQRIDTNPNKITSKIIKENVILAMMDDNRKESAINARLRAVRSLFNFLERERMVVHNPMDSVKLVRQKQTVIETFSREQIHALLRQPNQQTFTGLRDYTMILLLLETGLRIKELVNICVDDVKFDDNMIRVRSPKGSQERLVPFQSTMKRQLRKYLAVRGEVEHDFLFVSIDNKPVAIRTFQERFASYGKQARIKNVRCSPHTCRHTFAKMFVQNGGHAFTLQNILGHNSLEMTRRYVKLFSQDISQEHKKYSPIERLMI